MVHFRREKYVPRGGPDGGDGGRGGDVILQVDPHLNTLFHFHRHARFRGEDGGHGGTTDKTGKSAPPLIVRVPAGTLIFEQVTGDLLGDLTAPEQQLVICVGGRGGRGNPHFKNSRNQAPRIGEKGEPGQERSLRLELKLIADIGVVGAPNAGKSTLLAATTNASPKIAPYPFTTLVPNLGVAVLDDEISLIIADIPGLIEGAHMGVGLGHEFLRHIQRTRVLIHLLDGMAEDPLADFYQINAELALFDPALAAKPQIVALNKLDLPDAAARWPALKMALEKKGYHPMAISAVAHTNVRQLLFAAHAALAESPKLEIPDELPIYRFETDPNEYMIARLDGDVFQVTGAAIERAAAMTYWEHDQSVRRFQRIMETIGIDTQLRAAGVLSGHTVMIGEYELEWQE